MKYENEALKVIHENAKEKFKIGLISEARMREYDDMCLANHKSRPIPSQANSVSINKRIIAASSQQ